MTEHTGRISAWHPASWISVWFGAGLVPKMPGTMGSLAALPFAFFMQHYFGDNVLWLAAIAMFFIGWWAAHMFMTRLNLSGDPQQIVVDEVAAMWLTLSYGPYWLGIRWMWNPHAWVYDLLMFYALPFVLFRFFDILKPWPVSWADRKLPGALGVMVDDTLAAIYALLVYHGFAWILWSATHHAS